VSSWQHKAKCRLRDPRDYETANLPKGREAETARALCVGCPVIQQCAADAIQPIDMTALLGTDEPADRVLVTGMVRAGQPL
jgi:hypothetical protein